ncbi:MAG: OadG family protein [Bacilli bacterium]|nr:OadG family protein [Bacilli bacterium]
MYIPVLDAIDKGTTITVGEGALYSILAIAMVFAILLIIIGVTYLVFKITGLFDLKKELDAAKKAKEGASVPAAPSGEVTIKDDDMMAAVLVATIDYRLTHKSDVRVVSVKEIN